MIICLNICESPSTVDYQRGNHNESPNANKERYLVTLDIKPDMIICLKDVHTPNILS